MNPCFNCGEKERIYKDPDEEYGCVIQCGNCGFHISFIRSKPESSSDGSLPELEKLWEKMWELKTLAARVWELQEWMDRRWFLGR